MLPTGVSGVLDGCGPDRCISTFFWLIYCISLSAAAPECPSHLGDLVDVQELGKPDAEHVCGQPDGLPPLLVNFHQPGPASAAAD